MPTPTFYEIFDLVLKLGIVVSISLYVIQVYRERRNKKKESKERLIRVCKALLVEINDLDTWYKSVEYQALLKRHYTLEYSENLINTVPYEGMVNSGLITYLKEGTQKKLNDYYFIAATHNKRMVMLAEIYNRKGSTTEFDFLRDVATVTESEAWKLNEKELSIYENKMRALMPEIRKLLEEEIREIK